MDPKTLTNACSFMEVCVRPFTAADTWFLCLQLEIVGDETVFTASCLKALNTWKI